MTDDDDDHNPFADTAGRLAPTRAKLRAMLERGNQESIAHYIKKRLKDESPTED